MSTIAAPKKRKSGGGRPAMPEDQKKQAYTLRLAPDLHAVAMAAGRPRIEDILRGALIPER